ncbi:MAG TPA: potassium transporter TrkA [Flavobacteriales bacterium]|nr:potassium transporter TrkA [Flavobacteriales bacterium]
MNAGNFFQNIAHYKEVIIYIIGFIWILFASDYFAKYLQKIKLPLITGFLLTGIVCGPQALGLLKAEAVANLNFVNDLSLAFIAFAAGTELYLREIRSRFKSIVWNTLGQLVITFGLSSTIVFFLADYIPFMKAMNNAGKVAVSILMGTIFVARSPSSAIAVINEMRAKGPFTTTAIGVTVVKDVLVIILFTICFSISNSLILDHDFNIKSILLLVFELAMSFAGGYVLGKSISLMLRYTSKVPVKTVLLLLVGYSVFYFAHLIRTYSQDFIGVELYFEPLLICIVASFLVTNYSKYRPEFQFILHRNSPFIYVTFFTLTGAMMSLDVLVKVWGIALLLFFVRLVTMMIGTYIGSTIARDNKLHRKLGWMSYVTQAGVGLGLAIEISREYVGWGTEFATIVIAVIVLNQFVGPPLFKWALNKVGETHKRAEATHDGIRDAIIFGYEDSSMALGRQLIKNGWEVKIATFLQNVEEDENREIEIQHIDEISVSQLEKLEARKSESIILMLSDKENLKICELIYEHIGTKNVVVRLQDRYYINKFHKLGALIVEPATAIVSLLDHFVRSPLATSLLLGMEENQETIDIEVQDLNLHGVSLRDLRLPSDIIILSVTRKNQVIISHGYTRLRIGDIVTLVGSRKSLEETRLRFEE